MSPAEQKQHAHELVERLDASQLDAVVRLLEVMTDPVTHSLASAPIDDEAVTEQDIQDIAAARAAFDRGEGIPNEKILAEFGLTVADFERMGRTPLEPEDTGQ